MSNIATKSINLYRVIIDDPQLALSSDFRLLVEMAITHVPSSVVKVDHLELVPNTATVMLMPPEPSNVLQIDSFIVALESITQLVWGRFFFFANITDAEQANGCELAENIAISQTTICVVDNSSCFVFTKSTALVCELLANNSRLEVVKDDLSRILARPEDF